MAANDEQAEFWGGEVGRRWLLHERALEALTAEATERLLSLADPGPGERVLEVGCGSGGLSLALARAVGPEGAVLGLDISGPMVARAEARAAGLGWLSFRREDAQVAALPAEGFDLVASKFGAMFFADPVAAFRNLRGALRPGGRLALLTWGPVGANPFFRLGREVAVRRFGPPPDTGPPDGPGPFAFADLGRVTGILEAAGFAEVRAEAAEVALGAPGGAEGLAELASELGPAGAMLREAGAGEEERAALREELRAAFAPYGAGGGAGGVPGLVNLFAARRR